MISATSKSTTVLNSLKSEKISPQKSIFVCTFCQVFSSSISLIADHINSEHKDSLLLGTTAENFVSQLQALPNQNEKKCPRKVGRPRKIPLEKTLPEKKAPDPEPLPGPDGLYWCKKCIKYFKKSRQLSRHVCFDMDEDELLNESSEESDSSGEFRTYMNIEPTPWQRRPKNSRKEKFQVQSDKEIIEQTKEPVSKVIPNWREDPSYVPLFGNESERHAFEKHLKSIDYSCVDNLFVKEEKKVKRKRKNCFQSFGFIYSCIICQKVRESLTHIRMHCLTHTEVKPFTCPKCPYRSNTKGSLYSHMRNHTGNVFRCSKCSFQSTKRAHLLEHEDTHSSVPEWCKLCKNSYKNMRSLIAHVKKYHNNPGGKKYVKLLSSKNRKEISIMCQICPKKFTSQLKFDTHNQREHLETVTFPVTERNAEIMDNLQECVSETIQINESSLIQTPASNLDYQNDILAIKDPLAEIVLNNILHQSSENIELYEDVFQQSVDTRLLAPTDSQNENFSPDSASQRLSVNNTSQFNPSETILEECSKTLSLEILDECLRDPKFAEGVISKTCIPPKLQNECHETFDMPEMPLNFQDEPLIGSGIPKTDVNIPEGLTEVNSSLNETKPAEIKLFEKCRRAPAYVCCVCSGIFICPSTLKAHLKEHINTSSLIEEAAEDFEKMEERDADLEAILQDPADSCTEDERELEKLYSSSLDMIWYLPEVSVVLENDPALFDSLLEDISNFPISDKFDGTEDMDVKCSEVF